MFSQILRKKIYAFIAVSGTQAICQAINAITGLLLVRMMGKPELAIFTIINSLSLSLLNITDLGLNSSVVSLSLEHTNIAKHNEIFSTAYHLRYRYMVLAFIYTSILFIFFTLNKSIPLFYGFLLMSIAITEWYYKLHTSSIDLYLRITGKTKVLNLASLSYVILRSLFIAIFILLSANAITPIIGSFIATFLSYKILKNKVSEHFNYKLLPSSEIKKKIIDISKPQWLFIVYSLFQYQITLFIISSFGSISQLADYGALSRLSSIFQIINMSTFILLIPAFARQTNYKKAVLVYFISIGLLLSISTLFLILSYNYPSMFLLIIGTKYVDLTYVLPYMVIMTVSSNLGTLILSLNQSKGWVKNTWLVPILSIFIQIISVLFIDLSSLINVILISTIPSVILILIHGLIGIKGLLSLRTNYT